MKKINSGLRTRQKAYVHTKKKINGKYHSLVYTRNMWIALKVRSDLQLRLRTFFAIHLRATRAEFAPENIVIVARINELKSSSHYFNIYLNISSPQCPWLTVDIYDYLAGSQPSKFLSWPPPLR